MRHIHFVLFAVLFSLSACSFSFASGPGYAMNPGSYPGSMAMVHGPGKPARRVVDDPPEVARKPAKPAKVDPAPVEPAKPKRVGRADPAEPKAKFVGKLPEPAPKATFAGELPEPAPKARFTGKLPAKPAAPKARFVGKPPKAEPKPVPLTAPKFDWIGKAAAPRYAEPRRARS